MNYEKELEKFIPGGAHTYSRGKDQFPSNAPLVGMVHIYLELMEKNI